MAAAAAPVGFIGLGMMGLPMARSLLRHGRALLACDPNRRRARRAGGGRRKPAPSASPPRPPKSPKRPSAIILVLPDSKVVAHVVEGPGGLLPALRPGHLVVDMGSSLPAETRRLAAAAAGRGAAFIDAPVSGGVPKARDGHARHHARRRGRPLRPRRAGAARDGRGRRSAPARSAAPTP